MIAGIVIARGGSKRLPRKNVKLLCGHPLVAWSIMQSRCSKLVDRTILSTDDDEIEEIGRYYGAEIIRRPDWPDADQAAGTRVFVHALDVLEEQGTPAEFIVGLMPPCPLRKPGDIDRGIAEMLTRGVESIAPAVDLREATLNKKTQAGMCRPAIFDKSYSYVQPWGGMSFTTAEFYIRGYWDMVARVGSDWDSDVSEDARKHTADGTWDDIAVDAAWYPCEPWQVYEADLATEWDLLEVLMERFILKGRGMEVYTEYGGMNG